MEETLWQRTKTASLLQIIITNGLVTNIFHITWNDSSFTNCFKYSTVLTIILSCKIDVFTIPSSDAESLTIYISEVSISTPPNYLLTDIETEQRLEMPLQ